MPSSAPSASSSLSLHDALPIWDVSLVKSLVEALKVRQQDSNKRQPGPGMAGGKGQRRHVLVQLRGQMLECRFDIDANTNNSHRGRSEEHTSELQSPYDLVCRLLLLARAPVFPYTTLFRSGMSPW